MSTHSVITSCPWKEIVMVFNSRMKKSGCLDNTCIEKHKENMLRETDNLVGQRI